MRFKSVSIIAFVLLLLCLSAGTLLAQDEASELFARVNNLRASVGRAGYTYNAALASAAQNQAQWMLETGSVSHTRPDGSGPRTRALNAGYPSTTVGENIYIGGMASVDTAWTFWVNSGVHYAGMVNSAFTEMGVGVAHGANGAAYALVFGNSGGPPPPSSSGAAAVAAAADAPAQQGPPAYFAGVDENGNLMHMVQGGDTLGDIALIYGYTWDDLPRLMAMNNIADVRDLDVGSIFLVPAHGGTYTPTPGGPTETPLPPTEPPNTPTPMPASITPFVAFRPVSNPATLVVTPLEALTLAATLTLEATASPTRSGIATVAAVPTELAMVMAASPTLGGGASPSPAGTEIVQLPTLEPALQTSTNSGTTPNTWLIVALVLQVGVVLAAGFEFMRRAGKRRR